MILLLENIVVNLKLIYQPYLIYESHCGSRAGAARAHELSTEEALKLVGQLAEVGIKEVTLIGGEAFMRPDWLTIALAIASPGMRCTMTTGGFGISLEMAQRMKEAGIALVSISVDGLEATHDRLRGKKGSWQSAFRTMSHFREIDRSAALHRRAHSVVRGLAGSTPNLFTSYCICNAEVAEIS